MRRDRNSKCETSVRLRIVAVRLHRRPRKWNSNARWNNRGPQNNRDRWNSREGWNSHEPVLLSRRNVVSEMCNASSSVLNVRLVQLEPNVPSCDRNSSRVVNASQRQREHSRSRSHRFVENRGR